MISNNIISKPIYINISTEMQSTEHSYDLVLKVLEKCNQKHIIEAY